MNTTQISARLTMTNAERAAAAELRGARNGFKATMIEKYGKLWRGEQVAVEEIIEGEALSRASSLSELDTIRAQVRAEINHVER